MEHGNASQPNSHILPQQKRFAFLILAIIRSLQQLVHRLRITLHINFQQDRINFLIGSSIRYASFQSRTLKCLPIPPTFRLQPYSLWQKEDTSPTFPARSVSVCGPECTHLFREVSEASTTPLHFRPARLRKNSSSLHPHRDSFVQDSTELRKSVGINPTIVRSKRTVKKLTNVINAAHLSNPLPRRLPRRSARHRLRPTHIRK